MKFTNNYTQMCRDKNTEDNRGSRDTGRVVCDGLCKHRFAAARRPKHQHATRRVDADLFIKLKVRQRQLDGLPYFLFLNVHAADVGV